MEQAAFEGLGLGDLGGDAFDCAVDGGEEVGDFGLFVKTRKPNYELPNLFCADVLVDELKRSTRDRSYSSTHFPSQGIGDVPELSLELLLVVVSHEDLSEKTGKREESGRETAGRKLI